jgi:O-antigen/teichoic acid export membrane protein
MLYTRLQKAILGFLSDAKPAKAATFLSSFMVISGAAFGLLTTIVAARWLGPVQFGRAADFINIMSLFAVIGSFGYQYNFARNIENRSCNGKILEKSLGLSLLGILLAWLFFLGLQPERFDEGAWYVLLIIFTLAFVTSDQIHHLKYAQNEPLRAAIIKGPVVKIFPFILMISISFIGLEINPNTYLIIYISGSVLTCLFYWRLIKINWPDKPYVAEILPFYAVQILYFTPAIFLKILYVHVASFAVLAYLSIALLTGQAINLIGSSFVNQLAPQLRKALIDNNSKEVKRLLDITAFYPTSLVSPFVVFFIFYSSELLGYLGPDYENGILISFIGLSLISSGANLITGATGTIILMSEKRRLEVISGLIKAGSLFLCFFFLTNYTPIYSVPLAIVISEVVANIVKVYFVYTLTDVTPWSANHFASLIYSNLFLAMLLYIMTLLKRADENCLLVAFILTCSFASISVLRIIRGPN